ncbi:MAG TPA: hypothetical protein PLW44_15375, partial [Chitinophagales bacterium]|nr:hypothetical protein [Chitinophagales bacterium]
APLLVKQKWKSYYVAINPILTANFAYGKTRFRTLMGAACWYCQSFTPLIKLPLALTNYK